MSRSPREVSFRNEPPLRALAEVLDFLRLAIKQRRPYLASRPLGYLALSNVDRWLLARTLEVAAALETLLDHPDLEAVEGEVASLGRGMQDRYLPLCHARLLEGDSDADVRAGMTALFESLLWTARILLPFLPEASDEMFSLLAPHLAKPPAQVDHLPWPGESEGELFDEKILQEMATIFAVLDRGRALREEAGVPLWQPLSLCILRPRSESERQALLGNEGLLLRELGVKTAEIGADAERSAPEPVVELDLRLTPDLEDEGIARKVIEEAVALLRDARVRDQRLDLVCHGGRRIRRALDRHSDRVLDGTGVRRIVWSETGDGPSAVRFTVGDEEATVALSR